MIVQSGASPKTVAQARRQRAAPEIDSSISAWVEVETAAIARNFRRLRARLGGDVSIIATVKKEAYGHGLGPVGRALAAEPGLAAFGVWNVEEATALRMAGVRTPIFCLTVLHGDQLRAALELDVQLTVSNAAEAKDAADAAVGISRTAALHLAVDTGLTRLGLAPAEAAKEAKNIGAIKGARLVALYAHFADAWDDPDEARAQAQSLAAMANECGLAELPRHLGGSDAIALAGDPSLTRTVRAGIALFGYHPGIEDLEPAMTFKARVVYRRTARAGARVSYAGLHSLVRDSEIALLGVGYGNGYPVALTGRAEILVGGRRLPVLGQICMDQIAIDVTDAPEIAVGDTAVLFGRTEGDELGADEVSARGGTIPYELLCLAGKLNPRFNLD